MNEITEFNNLGDAQYYLSDIIRQFQARSFIATKEEMNKIYDSVLILQKGNAGNKTKEQEAILKKLHGYLFATMPVRPDLATSDYVEIVSDPYCDIEYFEKSLEDIQPQIEMMYLYRKILLAYDNSKAIEHYIEKSVNYTVKGLTERHMEYVQFKRKMLGLPIVEIPKTAGKNKDELFGDMKYPFTVADLKKKRKELAKKYHPDNGGDQETMAAIEALYQSMLYLCVDY